MKIKIEVATEAGMTYIYVKEGASYSDIECACWAQTGSELYAIVNQFKLNQ